MAGYDHKKIETKWQKKWQEEGIYKTSEEPSKPKCYVLDMFPYPSGEGLHVGHPKGYIATDIYSRFKKMNGANILHPMGWDAFGLPAENFAIANKIHPRLAVQKNISRYKRQLEILGFNYDWGREINTTDPAYYKWTQWIFLQLFHQGLAYESDEPINWCPSCLTGLANEDVEAGRCERCGSLVEKKPLRQWILKITDYADRLLEDLETLDKWPEHIKELQRNWIGRSEGALIGFAIAQIGADSMQISAEEGRRNSALSPSKSATSIEVFTTRPDTIEGATFLVIAPEHPLLWRLVSEEQKAAVEKYLHKIGSKSELERTDLNKEKTGVFTGAFAVNPWNGEKIPVWTTDYILMGVGSGAIMAVPAHDRRDFEFAKKFGLPAPEKPLVEAAKVLKKTRGRKEVRYKLRDWVFSRQRYWGEPIPLVFCQNCRQKIRNRRWKIKSGTYSKGELSNPGWIGVPEGELPVTLPEVEHYEPTGTGQSPLASIKEWVNTKCPKCGAPARRETNTMPQWAGSSWYYLRYMDPANDKELVAKEKEKYWAPVDVYVGGAEHATRHLIYARFWHKFLFEIGVVSTKEPFARFENVGLIIGEDGRKMSKRYGNIINPDEIVERLGADTLRIYEMFMGPFENQIAWSAEAIAGSRRFLEKIWRLQEKISPSRETGEQLVILFNQTIKKVSEDIENFRFNTAVSSLMILVNALDKLDSIASDVFEIFLKLLAPFGPHISEELWLGLGKSLSIHQQAWPQYDPAKIKTRLATVAVQVNGRVRAAIRLAPEATEEEVKTIALVQPAVVRHLSGQKVKKTIFIPAKVINFLTE